MRHIVDEQTCGERATRPAEASSQDPEVLRAALLREWGERRRADCLSRMQAEIVQLAIDQLVQQPNIEGFFGALTKTMVEEGESKACGVWLINETRDACHLWMVYVKGQLFMASGPDMDACPESTFPNRKMAAHLFEHTPGWTGTTEYEIGDARLPEDVRAFTRQHELVGTLATPLLLNGETLGWMTLFSLGTPEHETKWWRVVLIEAIARQAALALHHTRVVDMHRREERRKGILEERNRLARDIHDNLAQGFAAILMQLQAAQREASPALPPKVAASIDTAVDLARTHLTEARRSVGALRPNVSQSEDIATALKRVVSLARRTAEVPIELVADELPRLGDVIEREILGIAQEALTNAVRHARAKRITVRAEADRSVGLRLSVADDGRGMISDAPASSGFGMTSMQERADRIGASLTIVTGPRKGTEVVLAWQPASLPTQVYVAV
ncbi:MAG TPA: sensor histidine kinase [Vicinamibacterales bacterium]|jgi:signal transduction histidine kinase|nr:sensor histidine kinase [Vicinamibacterales bacterium]